MISEGMVSAGAPHSATSDPCLIFDGHNDVLVRLHRAGGVAAAGSFISGRNGAIDLGKARRGGFCGGFFSVFVPSTDDGIGIDSMADPDSDTPLPGPISAEEALPTVMTQAAILFDLERRGALKVVRSVADIRACMNQGRIAAILHLEGADALGADLATLDVLHAAGLRSLGPVWSRPTIFGSGVPFRFPSDPDIGDGLSAHGVRLVRRCNALGIMIDLSHLNEKGFWDVARHSDAPLVATHSAAHAICPSSRNLTDVQLKAIADSDGMVGVNFAVALLRSDGRELNDVPLEQLLRHVDHMIDILGEGRVGLGSDYDGAVMPREIPTVAELPRLRNAMERHGYGDEQIRKLCRENWLRVLGMTWVSQPPTNQ